MDRSEGDFSVFVSNTLDAIGYSRCMRKFRREQYSCRSEITFRKFNNEMRVILAGSKGEGISRLRESDLDIMLVHKNVICVDDITQCDARNDRRHLIQMDRRHTAPGYTLLSPLEDDPYLVMSSEGIDYLPNDVFIKAYNVGFNELTNAGNEFFSGRQGPAWSFNDLTGLPEDHVWAFSCQCPSILTPWLRRQRHHDWPSRQILQDMSVLEAHVVPVGFKKSYEQDLEWRICYTLAERALVCSFNDTQLKLYILLKFIAKSVLKPVCGGMTSYVMKNIVLWLSELIPTSMFRAELLIDCLVRSLQLLSISTREGVLPSYMIPERNLLSGNVCPGDKKRLMSALSDLTSERGNMLLRCEKMTQAMVKMYREPDAAREEGVKNDKLEILVLLRDFHIASRVHINEQLGPREMMEDYNQQAGDITGDSTLLNLRQQIYNLFMPDELSLRLRGKNIHNVYKNRCKRLMAQPS